MAAIACLRVLVDAERVGLSPASLGSVTLRFVTAYLDRRWLHPRRFGALSSYSFLLADPAADTLDVRELGRLSDELQTKLFGTAAMGEVSLLMFEGSLEAVNAFAALDNAEVRRALADPSLLPGGGRLSEVLGAGLTSERAPPAPESADTPDQPQAAAPTVRLQGVYFTLRELFIGDVVATMRDWRSHTSIVEGPEHMPADPVAFDASCVAAASALLADASIATKLYVPISYDGLARPSQRAKYEELLSLLPLDQKPRLAAAVYGVPRDPVFGALSQLRATLEPYFGSVDLRIEDPGFEVDKLAQRAVAGVSYALPHREPRERMSMLRRFAAARSHYKRRQIWASVTNVRTPQELSACAELGIPFVTGPAVTGLNVQPLGGHVRPITELPVG